MATYDWNDRVVLITGGTRGIGLETALCFARMGARTILTYRWGGSEAEAAARFAAEGLKAPRILCADVANEGDTLKLFKLLQAEYECIDGFVSNVSVAAMARDFGDFKLKGLIRSIEYTSWPLVAYTLQIHAHFGRWPRYVVALSSFGTERLAMHYDFVAASKSVVETLIPYLSWRLRSEGVHVNGVTCGLARTESSIGAVAGDFAAFEAWHQQAIGPIPYVKIEEVASAIYALCSGHLDGMNGQMLTVDDGSMSFAENRYGLYRAFLQNTQGVKP